MQTDFNIESLGIVSESAVNATGTNPIALVYRGPASCVGYSEVIATLLKKNTLCNFNVIYAGPNENMSVQAGIQLQMWFCMHSPEVRRA